MLNVFWWNYNCRASDAASAHLRDHPVKTGLVFDTIDDCFKAEEQMRGEYARLQRVAHLGRSQSKGGTVCRQPEVQWRRDGVETTGTCIPHAKHMFAPD